MEPTKLTVALTENGRIWSQTRAVHSYLLSILLKSGVLMTLACIQVLYASRIARLVASKDDIHFQWRGRENSEGIMRFGPSCNGSISFLGNGIIGGTFNNLYGDFEFQGRRLPGPPTPVRTAASMKDEWDGYNQDAYDEANRARWR